MRRGPVFVSCLLIVGVLSACSSPSEPTDAASASPSASAVSAESLVGTWSGDISGFGDEGYRQLTKRVEIVKADGQAFEGTVSYEQNTPEKMSGVVTTDGALHFVDTDGVYDAMPLGDGTYEITYSEPSPDDQTYLVGTLTRQ